MLCTLLVCSLYLKVHSSRNVFYPELTRMLHSLAITIHGTDLQASLSSRVHQGVQTLSLKRLKSVWKSTASWIRKKWTSLGDLQCSFEMEHGNMDQIIPKCAHSGPGLLNPAHPTLWQLSSAGSEVELGQAAVLSSDPRLAAVTRRTSGQFQVHHLSKMQNSTIRTMPFPGKASQGHLLVGENKLCKKENLCRRSELLQKQGVCEVLSLPCGKCTVKQET